MLDSPEPPTCQEAQISLDTHQLSPTPPGAGIAALPASTKHADVISAITGHHTTLVESDRRYFAPPREDEMGVDIPLHEPYGQAAS